MSCRSSAANSQLPQLERPTRRSHKSSNNGCNSQLCSSYLVGLLACLLVVGGIFLAFHRWDYLWLAVSAVGVLLILVGASLHYCGGDGIGGKQTQTAESGTQQQARKRGSNHHRIVCDQGNHNERLLPSAPPTSSTSSGHNFSVSQLSLNMLPPFFPSYDTISLGPQGMSSPNNGTPATSPIMHLNGQSFLLLPIGGSTMETLPDTQSLARRLSTHLAVLEQQQSFAQKRCYEFANLDLGTANSSSNIFNFLTAASVAKESPPDEQTLHVALPPEVVIPSTKSNSEVQMLQDDVISETNPIVDSVTAAIDEEPIYQVPRLISTPTLSNNTCDDENSADPSILMPAESNCNPIDVPTVVVQECDQRNNLESPERNDQPTIEQSVPNDEDRISFVIPEIVENDIPILETSESHVRGNTLESLLDGNTLDSQTEDSSVCGSRACTPELPPSYEEVAPPSFKELGRLEFAYQTL